MRSLKITAMLLLAIAGLTSVTSCDSKITSPQGGKQPRIELVPQALGNSWVFRTRTYGYEEPYGEVIDTFQIDTAFMWNSRLWFGVRGGSNFASNDSLGYWSLAFDEDSAAPTAKVDYYYPVQTGQTWKIGEDSVTIRVTDTKHQATTPAGTFTGCVRYDFVYEAGITDYVIFKPGVGYIKSEFTNSKHYPVVSFISELMSYHLED